MKRYIYTLIALTIALLFYKVSSVEGATMFFDSFTGGYNDNLWTVQFSTPIASAFGIGDTNSGVYYVLASTIPSIPANNIIKFDMKINAIPSEVWFSCNDSDGSRNERRVALRSNGTFTFEVFVNGGGIGSNFMNWDNTSGIHNFEFICLNSSLILKEDGVTLGSWQHTSTFTPEKIRFFYRNGDSEFSNYQLCDTDGCDPYPTPTAIPTPTPTPTPTSAPTPTPTVSKKVIIVPGMRGSWNRDALLYCKTTGYSGAWTAWNAVTGDDFQPLLDSLTNSGYEPLPFYYDWRKTVTESAPILATFIQNNVSAAEKLYLVGHSFGGLVGRAYLESTQANSQLDKLLTVGSPHQGTTLSYPAWSGGQVMDDINLRLALIVLQIGCQRKYGWSSRETVRNLFPAIQNTLPTFDYLKDKQAQVVKPVSNMNSQNNWLPTSLESPFFDVTVGTLTGTGHNTLKMLEVAPPSRNDIRLGNWLDGKPTGKKEYDDGDGLVRAQSAELLGAQNFQLPLDHGELISSTQAINAILGFLSGAPAIQSLSTLNSNSLTRPINSSDAATALLIIIDGASAKLTDKNGNQIQDKEGQITILEPHDEAYTLAIQPNGRRLPWWKKPIYRVVVVQLFENGTSNWKEYTQEGFFSKKWTLRFDRKNNNSDILRDL